MERWPAKLIFHCERGPQVNEGANRTFEVKQFLLLVAVIAVILGALLVSLYVLDLVKLAELQNDLRKVFGVLLVAALAGILIMFLVKVAQKR
jgi:hypothetical protein